MDRESKKVIIFFLTFFSIFIIIVVIDEISPPISEQRFDRNANRFDALNVNGTFDTAIFNHQRITFFLEDDTTTYAFVCAYKFPDDNNYFFMTNVNKGDIVIKPSFSDSIKVIKKDKVLIYSH